MKITDIKLIPVNKFLFVKVYTDEGITGIGESGDWGFLESSGEVIKSFREYLIGQDPLRIEHHWQYMYRCFHFRGAAVMGALSAIDIALWDIAGKFYGVPVYQLLGGKCRDTVRVYSHVSGGSFEELMESCLAEKEKGFTAIGHLSPFLDEPRNTRYFETYARKISSGVERIGKIREAVGLDVDLCIENHRRLNPAEAVALAAQLEPLLPMFYEDPILPDNFDSMAWVAQKIRIPLATGERIHTPQEYQMLVKRQALVLLGRAGQHLRVRRLYRGEKDRGHRRGEPDRNHPPQSVKPGCDGGLHPVRRGHPQLHHPGVPGPGRPGGPRPLCVRKDRQVRVPRFGYRERYAGVQGRIFGGSRRAGNRHRAGGRGRGEVPL